MFRKKMCKKFILPIVLSITILLPYFSQSFIYAQEDSNDTNYITIEENGESTAEVPYRNVIYYGDWSIWGGQELYYPKYIPANLYTHLNYAFINFDSNGNFKFTDADAAFGADVGSGNGWNLELSGCIPAINALRYKNPNMKIGFSIGGWSKSNNFTVVADSPEKRKNFIDNIIKFLVYTGMDFVDIDWEYPTSVRQPDKVDNQNDEGTPNSKPKDKENFNILMQELRISLDKLGKEQNKYYELSAALPGSVKQLEKCIDVEKIFKTLDFANIMTYDLSGAFEETSGHHTALYTNPKDKNAHSIQKVVEYLKSKKVDMKKVDIGVAMYSRGWKTVEKGNDDKYPGLFQPAKLTNKDADQTPSRGADNELPLKAGDGGRAGGVWSYRSLDKLKKSDSTLKEYWDDIAKAPYMYSNSTQSFYTYDNIRSVKEKIDFVKKNNLGGIISWMASQDKPVDSGFSRKELSEVIKLGFYGNNSIPSSVKFPNPKLNIDIKASIVSLDSDKKGYSFKIDNKEKLVEQGDMLLANKYYSTIKKAHLIIKMKDGKTFTGGDYKAGKVTTSGNKTYVDLSGVWDAKFIRPGVSYDFRLVPDDEMILDPLNVEEIILEQYYNDDVKLSSQLVYSKLGKDDTEDIEKDKKDEESDKKDIEKDKKDKESDKKDIEKDKKDEESDKKDIEKDKKDEESDKKDIEKDKKDEESDKKDIEKDKKDEESDKKDIEKDKKDEESDKKDIEKDKKDKESDKKDIEKDKN